MITIHGSITSTFFSPINQFNKNVNISIFTSSAFLLILIIISFFVAFLDKYAFIGIMLFNLCIVYMWWYFYIFHNTNNTNSVFFEFVLFFIENQTITCNIVMLVLFLASILLIVIKFEFKIENNIINKIALTFYVFFVIFTVYYLIGLFRGVLYMLSPTNIFTLFANIIIMLLSLVCIIYLIGSITWLESIATSFLTDMFIAISILCVLYYIFYFATVNVDDNIFINIYVFFTTFTLLKSVLFICFLIMTLCLLILPIFMFQNNVNIQLLYNRIFITLILLVCINSIYVVYHYIFYWLNVLLQLHMNLFVMIFAVVFILLFFGLSFMFPSLIIFSIIGLVFMTLYIIFQSLLIANNNEQTYFLLQYKSNVNLFSLSVFSWFILIISIVIANIIYIVNGANKIMSFVIVNLCIFIFLLLIYLMHQYFIANILFTNIYLYIIFILLSILLIFLIFASDIINMTITYLLLFLFLLIFILLFSLHQNLYINTSTLVNDTINIIAKNTIDICTEYDKQVALASTIFNTENINQLINQRTLINNTYNKQNIQQNTYIQQRINEKKEISTNLNGLQATINNNQESIDAFNNIKEINNNRCSFINNLLDNNNLNNIKKINVLNNLNLSNETIKQMQYNDTFFTKLYNRYYGLTNILNNNGIPSFRLTTFGDLITNDSINKFGILTNEFTNNTLLNKEALWNRNEVINQYHYYDDAVFNYFKSDFVTLNNIDLKNEFTVYDRLKLTYDTFNNLEYSNNMISLYKKYVIKISNIMLFYNIQNNNMYVIDANNIQNCVHFNEYETIYYPFTYESEMLNVKQTYVPNNDQLTYTTQHTIPSTIQEFQIYQTTLLNGDILTHYSIGNYNINDIIYKTKNNINILLPISNSMKRNINYGRICIIESLNSMNFTIIIFLSNYIYIANYNMNNYNNDLSTIQTAYDNTTYLSNLTYQTNTNETIVIETLYESNQSLNNRTKIQNAISTINENKTLNIYSTISAQFENERYLLYT